ncbi:MAG: amidohydrolase, partial [Pseudomonadota bacterium]
MIIDAWAQHATLRHAQNPMFDSLRRWGKGAIPTEPLPVSATLAAMDEGGVQTSLISAWHAPSGNLITNDEVAGFCA